MFGKRTPEKTLARASRILGITLKDGKLRPTGAALMATTTPAIVAADATAVVEAATGRVVVQDSAGRRFSVKAKDARWVDMFITALAEYRESVKA